MHFFLSIERSHQRLWVPSHVAAHHDAIHAFPTSLKPPHTHTRRARARARYPSHRLLRTTYSWKDAPVGEARHPEARHPEARHPEARRSAGLPGEVPLEDGVG